MKNAILGRVFDYLVYFLLFFTPLLFIPGLNLAFEIPKVALFRVCGGFMLFFYIWRLSKERKMAVLSAFQQKTVRLAVFLFLVVVVISVVFSVAPVLSFWGGYFRLAGAYSLFFYFLFFLLLAVSFHEKRQWDNALWAMLYGFLGVSIYAILQKFGVDLDGLNLMRNSLGRVHSSIGHPSYLATYLVLVGPVVVAFVSKKKKWAAVLAGALGLAALWLTGSRAAMLGLLVGGMFFLMFYRKWFVVVLLVVAICASFILPRFGDMRSIDTRKLLWSGSIQLLYDRPIFGHGLDTFHLVFQKYADPKLNELEKPETIADRAHNVILDIGVSSGLAGISVYLYGFLLIFWLGLKNLKRDKKMILSVLSGMLAYFVSNLFGFSVSLHYVMSVFVVCLLMFLVSVKTVEKPMKLPKLTLVLVGVFVAGAILFQSVLMVAADYYAKAGDFGAAAGLQPNQSYYNYIYAEVLRQNDYHDEALYYADLGGKFVNYEDGLYWYLKWKISGEKNDLEKAHSLMPYYLPICESLQTEC